MAFSQCVGNDAWRQTMLEEMKRELSFYPDVQFIYRDANGSNERQVAQISDLMRRHVDLLIVSPNETQPLTPIVDSVFREKIPVIVTDRKTGSGLYHAYVGADNVAIGRLAGQYIHQLSSKRLNIGMISGLGGSSASIERQRGLRKVVDSLPSMRIGIALEGDWTKETAYRLAKANLSELLKQDVVLAFNDQMAKGVQQAYTEAGHTDRKILGIDALPGEGNGLEAVNKGVLYASLLYPTGGAEAIRTAIAILEKKPFIRDNILGTVVIDHTNAALMALQSQKIKDQQEDIDKRQQLIATQQEVYKNQRTTLNTLAVSLALAVAFGALSLIVIRSNRKKNRNLEQQNIEIKQQQQQIISMSKQVQEAADAKNRFFAQVSHEFKTPLTLILAPLNILQTERQLSAEGREQLHRIERNANTLLQLLQSLVDIHRSDNTKLQLKATCTALPAFIRQVLANFKPFAQHQHISLSFSNQSTVTEIWIDPYLMEQALSNLLANAIQFTKERGKIAILLEDNSFGDFIYIRVQDDGTGIAPSDIDHVFEPFYQSQPNHQGSGIGLAHVKQIVELHHGQITVSSKINVGSSFTLRLPVGNAHLSQEEIYRLPANAPPEQHGIAFATDQHDLSSFYSHKAATIFIIDDHAEIRQLLRSIMNKQYNLVFAKNIGEAEEKLRDQLPDLIISDIMLPDGSGLEFLKTMKGSTGLSHIPVLLLSAVDSEESKLDGIRLRADAYINKPFKVPHLLAMVENLLETRKQLKAHFSSIPQGVHNSMQDHSSMSDQDKRFLQHVELLVEERLSDQKLTTEELAKALQISRVQLYRKAKSLLNCSMNEYILQRRLTKAKHLIREGFHINEVANEVGFSSANYFAVAFKKHFGQSPSAFRKELFKR
ncbi:sensor histidine kinase [Sphingobacterium griseoflavum]|uniref:histidine kinase n=1 Tax=Sphingobacterium griseoflavum TaxID=1474952 RepID=A0ABQ3HVW5_9SPHI|nr:sensor histidine kinase [Sphingobacterium griseoflavum]